MLKALAFDIDGTLSCGNNRITSRLQEDLNWLDRQGYHLIVASGRSYVDICEFQKLNNIHCSSVVLNGAAMFDENGHAENCMYLDNEVFESISGLLQTLDLPFICYLEEDVIEFKCSRKPYGMVMSEYLNLCSDAQKLFARFKSADEFHFDHNKILKLEICFEDLNNVDEVRQQLSVYDSIHVVSSMGFNLEITSKMATKGDCLLKYIQKHGYAEDELMVFGDSENDISMFKMFDNSVLVVNDDRDLGVKTKYVTDSCKDDGVAKFLESYFKIDK